jgi:hypothetical protein
MPTLKLKLKICESCGCDSFKVYDETGAYDAIVNPNGWNSVDTLIASVTSATITVVQPNSTVVQTILDITPLPNLVENPVKITSAMLGISGSLPSGVYKISYIVSGLDHLGVAYTVSNTVTKLFICAAKCCLDSMLDSIEVDEYCHKPDAKTRRVDNAYLALKAAKAAMDTGKPKRAQELIDFVNSVCVNANCDC